MRVSKILQAGLLLYLSACSHHPKQIVNADLPPSTVWQQRINIGAFADASWTYFGFYDKEGTFEHQYGGQDQGYYEYLFLGPEQPIQSFKVQARMSAETHERGKPEETSDVTLSVNGVEVGTQTIMPDDMKGQLYTWEVKDPAQIERLKIKQGPTNTLRFEVKAGAKNRFGLCLYGDAIDGKSQGTQIVVEMKPR